MDPTVYGPALEFTLSWLRANPLLHQNFGRFNDSEDVNAKFHALLDLPYPVPTDFSRTQSRTILNRAKQHKRAVFQAALRHLENNGSGADDLQVLGKTRSAQLPKLRRSRNNISNYDAPDFVPPPAYPADPAGPQKTSKGVEDSDVRGPEMKGGVEKDKEEEEEEEEEEEDEEEEEEDGLNHTAKSSTSVRTSGQLPPSSSPPPITTTHSLTDRDPDNTPSPSLPAPPAPTGKPSPRNCFGCCRHFLKSSDPADLPCNNSLSCCSHPSTPKPKTIPGPQKPRTPDDRITVAEHESALQALTARIATLEKRLETQEDISRKQQEFCDGVKKVLSLKRELDITISKLIGSPYSDPAAAVVSSPPRPSKKRKMNQEKEYEVDP